ncbi:MAG: DNA polymerase III subunit beta [Candidatus Niyogibacteria bacterium CG10_big_fil_rev_8_21_14_0_10_46_36]|uniref:Beta sliding clamp n=1 Tax=Candidatus Niyogibacteria bacterium CG10_big_fil_rev_8_21_14_0_10_46_36 TaxID=1974726 RepID=A0A2H0TDI5_9BACT|nr:MAG: DNA polymerase III subunit beta [Candidatus Niyogibacteria bacterium CG10_big_fil_rev_8_21_14_0_10_46_36]
MNTSCVKEDLQKALTVAERHTSAEENLPLLKGVLLESSENKLYVRSTNLDTGIEVFVPTKTKRKGSVVVPAKTFSSFLTTLPDERITLDVKNGNLVVTTPSTSTTIKGYSADDFPPFPKLKKTTSIQISNDDLSRDLLSVVIAASSSEIKPEISSVLFSVQKKGIKFVATDSFRLAEKTIPFSSDQYYSLLFPFRHVLELIKVVEIFPSSLEILFDSNQAILRGNNFLYFARLRDASFPQYEQIIPTSFATEVTLKKSNFLKAIRGASIFSGRLREVCFNVYPEDNLFEVVTKNSDIGEYVSQIPAKVTGERLSVNFNYGYIIDGINQISSDDIILRFNGESKPVLIQNPYNASYIYLAMPMKNI